MTTTVDQLPRRSSYGCKPYGSISAPRSGEKHDRNMKRLSNLLDASTSAWHAGAIVPMRFTGFEGEANRICHSVRDGKNYKRKDASDVLDVILIGAGVSGLTAAYKLRDKLRVRVIEKEGSIGGASRRGNWKGIYYSYGAADTGPTYEIEYEGKRINYLEPLFKELGVPWKRVADPSDAFLFKNRLVIDPFSRPGMDYPLRVRREKGSKMLSRTLKRSRRSSENLLFRLKRTRQKSCSSIRRT